ncbi:hypothetical protein ANN_10518 [Periplaneta americana]|uniref:Rab-GAP TBC domain-containing protein n=1 Tax=Periplaneta americana TaxID=6978 RepID=A0ABQ8TS24_PERAM|nr:hypothetical protein ANN_10518 [Periplaneta americana]
MAGLCEGGNEPSGSLKAICKFWLLPNLGSCTLVAFPPAKKSELLIGTVDGSLHLVNIELGAVTGKLEGHTSPPKLVTFSSTGRYCLTAATEEAVVWDLHSNTQAYRLSLRKDVVVKQVIFMPVTDNILACFQDDAIHIWEFDSFDCIKQILPETWKTHHLKTIAFTRQVTLVSLLFSNGRAMVIGGHSPVLVVFSLDGWTVEKVIKLPENVSGVRHIEFLPQLFDGGANKVLGLLSSHCNLHFLDIESSSFLRTATALTSINRFTCSSNGKYIACILQSGEVDIYRSCQLLDTKSPEEPVVTEKAVSPEVQEVEVEKKPAVQQRNKDSTKEKLLKVHKQIKETLDLNRLRPILKEFGEYPESYRCLIWRTILELPCNQPAYMSLIKREIHPAFARLEEQYPLENRSALKHLKRLLSCLAHWSSLFTEVKFLPLFVFPFVKVFQNDPFVCFEAITTIIWNWCQHWFEYFPFPPINVLSMVENVLGEHDSELLDFYYEKGVKSNLYAWSLLEVAFSEVLCRSDWLRLWDHILSNEPAFFLMAVVAYNIICRRAIMSCKHHDDFEKPHRIIEHERDSPKVNVFCALSQRKLYEPFFFIEATVTGHSYLDMLEQWLVPQLRQDLDDDFIFQQDGALPHFHNAVRAYLNTEVSDHWIGRAGFFFHNQNPVDMKKFLSKTYMLCSKTRKEVHPRQYLNSFRPLEKGSYPVFNEYPKFIVDYKSRKMKQLQKEEETLLQEYQASLKQKAEQEKRAHEERHLAIQEKRLKDLENAYEETLRQEELRVSEKRQKILALRRDLRQRDLELLEAARTRFMRQNVQKRHRALSQLLDDIERKRAQEEAEIADAEDEIQHHYTELLTHKQNLEHQLGNAYDAVPPPNAEHHALHHQQEQLADDVRKLRSEATSQHHTKQVDIATCMAMVDELVQRAELALAREMAERQKNLESGHSNMKFKACIQNIPFPDPEDKKLFVIQLESETRKLEQEVDALLNQLTEARLQEGTSRMQEVAHSQADRQLLNKEQEEVLQLKRDNSPTRRPHFSWDEAVRTYTDSPEELWQQGRSLRAASLNCGTSRGE